MATLIDQQFFARLHELNERFASSVPATLTRLRALRAGVDIDTPDPAHVQELQQVLHTIAGSAATFGFRTFGQQARSLEQRLRVLMAFERVAPADWHGWLAALEDYIVWAERDPKADKFDSEQ